MYNFIDIYNVDCGNKMKGNKRIANRRIKQLANIKKSLGNKLKGAFVDC